MKAYKVELLIINFDGLTEKEIKDEIENVNYGNDCISPNVMDIVGVEIEWDDNHPLNDTNTMKEEYNRLFAGKQNNH